MTNLTISLDESIVRGARIRAIQEGTSLSAKVREFLRLYVEGTATQEMQLKQAATARLMDSITQASAASKPSSTVKAKTGTLRDEMYANDFRAQARKT
jgi:plasmid stability protein